MKKKLIQKKAKDIYQVFKHTHTRSLEIIPVKKQYCGNKEWKSTESSIKSEENEDCQSQVIIPN